MTPPTPRPRRPRRRWTARSVWRYFFGYGNALLCGASLLALTAWLSRNAPGSFGFAATLLAPLLMGVVAAYTWGEIELSDGEIVLGSLLLTLLSLVGAWFVLHEGVICLIVVTPLLWLMLFLGCLLGNIWYRKNRGPIRSSLIPILVVLLVIDCRAQRVFHDSVTTSLLVHAPAAEVARHIVAFPPIREPSDYWLCRVGLPYPVVTTAEAARVGAARKCILSQNVVIEERISEYRPGRSVEFEITKQPHWPEISNHASLERGRIEVRDNGDGTSTLVGTSWYSLHVFPAVYFNLWVVPGIHNVHYRVFDHIRTLSEAKPR